MVLLRYGPSVQRHGFHLQPERCELGRAAGAEQAAGGALAQAAACVVNHHPPTAARGANKLKASGFCRSPPGAATPESGFDHASMGRHLAREHLGVNVAAVLAETDGREMFLSAFPLETFLGRPGGAAWPKDHAASPHSGASAR
jgi:hypothetical protein